MAKARLGSCVCAACTSSMRTPKEPGFMPRVGPLSCGMRYLRELSSLGATHMPHSPVRRLIVFRCGGGTQPFSGTGGSLAPTGSGWVHRRPREA
jgi:hypothetical protein